MKIAVILKQVPDTEADIVIHPDDAARIVEDDIKWIMNPYDEFAVEAAVAIAEENGGETVAVCIGTERAEQVIRTAMAMGIDAGILIPGDDAVQADIITQAGILAKALEDTSPDLILCGREFIDTGDDALAGALAEKMNRPHIMNVSRLEFTNGCIAAEREADGITLRITMDLPGVVSCQKGLNEPRYPNLMAVRRAQKKPLETRTLSELGYDRLPVMSRLLKLSAPPARSAGRQVTGDPNDTAKQAADWLANDARAF